MAQRSYPRGVALIPKLKIDSKRFAVLAVIAALIGLVITPVLTVAAMVLAGVGWRSAPRWTRLTLLIGAVLFVAYHVSTKQPPARHS
jgi:uncharacterized membrane protein